MVKEIVVTHTIWYTF